MKTLHTKFSLLAIFPAAAAILLMLPAPLARAATTNPINLVNPSFEFNTTGQVFAAKILGGYNVTGNDVAGWLDAGSTYVNSGVDYAGDGGNITENGNVFAFCDSGDSGAYQITTYQMEAGNPVTLTWWAKSTWGSAGQVVTLSSATSTTSSFSSLTTLATSPTALNNTGNGGAYTPYTLAYTPSSADAGKYVTVSFKAAGTAGGSWAAFDNFALSVVANNVGAVSAANSTLSPSVDSITANGGSTQVITVQARDNDNNNETTGGSTVVFSLSGTGKISATTDNGNGTYSATLTAPTGLGTGTVTATLNGTAVGTSVSANETVATYYPSAIGSAVPNLTSALTTNFNTGAASFQTVFYPATGLGPIYNDSACSNCHNFPAFGGGGSALLTRFGKTSGGVFNPLTSEDGTLLHAAYTNSNCIETIPTDANVTALRRTRALFGAGLIEAIPDSVIENNAMLPNVDNIIGVPALVTDPIDGKVHAGRFGWKGQYASLTAFIADAENNEIGLTNRFETTGYAPDGNTALYNEYNVLPNPKDVINSKSGKANLDTDADYVRLLAPAPTVVLSGSAVAGQALFHQISCDECHTPSLPTSASFTPISDLSSETSSPIAALSNQSAPLYSDLLLHNMGTLNDGIAEGAASPNQMMTAPLWGLRYKVPYLHNGSATNSLDAAIRAHAGDAASAENRYANLTATQQQEVVAFLNSL
jgi:CxxC motif-containing protein (DUF1111 family)